MSDSVGTTFRGKRRYHSLLETRVPLPPSLPLSSSNSILLIVRSRKNRWEIFGNGQKGVLADRLGEKIYQVSYIYREITRGEFTGTYITIVFESCQY